MAELATIARPYAEALFKAGADAVMATELARIAQVTADEQLQMFAQSPRVNHAQVIEVIQSVLGGPISPSLVNLLQAVLENGRLNAMVEISHQVRQLINTRMGVAAATIESAFELTPEQLNEIQKSLERRFNRKLDATVVIKPSLIGGIRVVVGDEVMDTSVKARLEQMKVALTA